MASTIAPSIPVISKFLGVNTRATPAARSFWASACGIMPPTITGIAEKYDVSPAQVVLRWHLQLGNVVIPKSVTPERIQSNFEVFGFELADDDMSAIDALDRDERIGPHPDHFGG